MRTYLALTQMAIQRQFTYRAAMLAGLTTNIFFGLLRASVMVALYGARQQMEGMTLQDAITYTGLAQASIAFLTLFSWFEIIYSVENGQVGADLLKPMSYYSFWMAQDLGQALVNLVFRGLTIFVFYAIFFDITYPTSTSQWAALVVCIFLSWMVSFSWRFLVNLSAFWVPNARGLGRLFFGLSWILSGFFMPLRFFPDWFVQIAYLTPFPCMINTMVEIYLGLITGTAVIYALMLQAAWGIGMIIVGQIVLQAGVRRLVIQGG